METKLRENTMVLRLESHVLNRELKRPRRRLCQRCDQSNAFRFEEEEGIVNREGGYTEAI